jgi:hypothetical protein
MVDDLAAMREFRQVHSVMHLALLGLFDAYQGHPGGLGTWIKLQGDWLQPACLALSVLEPDRERPHAMDDRSFAREEQTRSSL